jgi:hypothetical protein
MILTKCPCCAASIQVDVVDEGGEKKLQLSKVPEAPAPVKSDRDAIMELVEGDGAAGS